MVGRQDSDLMSGQIGILIGNCETKSERDSAELTTMTQYFFDFRSAGIVSRDEEGVDLTDRTLLTVWPSALRP